MQRLRRAWRTVALELLLVGALYFGIRAWQIRSLTDGPAPALEGISMEGSPLSLAQRRGQPTVVYFFATWCSACKLLQPNIDALNRSQRVLAVASHSGTDAEVRAFLDSRGLVWDVLNDPDGVLADRFGVRAFPTTFFITPAGEIRTAEVGYTTTPGLRLRRWWAGRGLWPWSDAPLPEVESPPPLPQAP